MTNHLCSTDILTPWVIMLIGYITAESFFFYRFPTDVFPSSYISTTHAPIILNLYELLQKFLKIWSKILKPNF